MGNPAMEWEPFTAPPTKGAWARTLAFFRAELAPWHPRRWARADMPWRPTLVGAALGAAFVRLPPALVERVYSTHLYAGVQPLLTSLSNLMPFALFDLLSVTVAVLWIWL